MKKVLVFFFVAFSALYSCKSTAQLGTKKIIFTKQDTLRGSITPERAWWNVLRYNISITPNYANRSITGEITIVYAAKKNASGNYKMQIDLQEPMKITNAYCSNEQNNVLRKSAGSNVSNAVNLAKRLNYYRIGNVYYINEAPHSAKVDSITIEFSGNPKVAVNAPWDGGWIFTKDKNGRPWMTVACQGLGASVWYPCKDHQSDEPDNGASLKITVPDSLVAVANGRLTSKLKNENGTTSWKWEVKNPINNYNIVPYIGNYVLRHEDFAGEKGKLDCDYWVLDYSLEKSIKQFDANVKPMLKCFENWFGPYPFYEDGYKLVESPHLGMEHQSAIAYGNKFLNGYLGSDLSGTGVGKSWDYIIVHESGHEWFANNITTNDIADMWVHEGFTDYSETLFVECFYGDKEFGNKYVQGLQKNIQNDEPIIGPYGVNKEGSGDMYYKGANLIHTIRQIIGNDSLFRQILRGMNANFYHKTISSKDVETYISHVSKKDFSKIFDQYLRTTKIPVLEFKYLSKKTDLNNYELQYRWSNVVPGFDMPIKIKFADKEILLHPIEEFKTTTVAAEDKNSLPQELSIDNNFYVETKRLP